MESGGPGIYYREFAPCEALRQHVRAFFTCTASEGRCEDRALTREDPVRAFCPAVFADGHVSIVVAIGKQGEAIGPMTAARPATMGTAGGAVGAYFRAAAARAFTGVPTSELTDRVVPLEELWGGAGFELEARIAEADDDGERIGMLEEALAKRLVGAPSPATSVDVAGLAAAVVRERGDMTVEQLADAAGVSRQRLTRVFRESVGVAPKLYCRLARFRAALRNASNGADWARMAMELGYSDQSHMIAEFREFSSVTPGALEAPAFFHPFLKRPTQARRPALPA